MMENTDARTDTSTLHGYGQRRRSPRGRGRGRGGNGRGGHSSKTDASQQASEAHQAKQITNPNLQINKAFDSLRTQPAQPPQPEQHAQHGQPTQQGGKVATKKNIQALKRQHDELTATLEDRKKHLDSLTEDITLASAKLEQIRDINKQHAKKEEELNEKERELVQREQELEDKKAVAELKTTQYKSLLNTIALAAQPDIIACIDKIIEFYYELLKHEVHKAEEEHGKLLSTTDLYYCLFAQSETMTQENEQLRARLQSLEDNTPR